MTEGLDFSPETFGLLNAEDYDTHHDPGTTEAAVALISDLAGQGRILELAIGTGRIALPLAAAGHDVSGIEASPEMVGRLREKPGGDAIPVTIGDMADVAVKGPFDHVFLVYNTLFNLTSQDAQVRCFRNVAKVLSPGGTFLIEAFVPDFSRFRDNQSVGINRIGMDHVWLDAIQHDPVAQQLAFQRVRITADGTQLVPLQLRYAYPAELDLMARLAGLVLDARWGGYDRQPFAAHSTMHVSLYRKAE